MVARAAAAGTYRTQLRVGVPADPRGAGSWFRRRLAQACPPLSGSLGTIREVRAWVGGTESVPGNRDRTRPPRSSGSHRLRGPRVGDITLASNVLRSELYTNDEPLGFTGRAPASPVQQLHRGGGFSSQPGGLCGRRRCGVARPRTTLGPQLSRTRAHWLRGCRTGDGPMLWSGDEASRRVALRPRRATPAACPAVPAWIILARGGRSVHRRRGPAPTG